MTMWHFSIDKFERIGDSTRFKVLSFEAEGSTVEEALAKINIPPGHKVWAYYEVPDGSEADQAE